MKWFNRWFRNMCEEAWNESQQANEIQLTATDSDRSGPQLNGMNFVLYKAVGGHILECRAYNHKIDRTEGTLYMIREDEDFAKQVAQAIMMEQMKL